MVGMIQVQAGRPNLSQLLEKMAGRAGSVADLGAALDSKTHNAHLPCAAVSTHLGRVLTFAEIT